MSRSAPRSNYTLPPPAFRAGTPESVFRAYSKTERKFLLVAHYEKRSKKENVDDRYLSHLLREMVFFIPKAARPRPAK